MLLVRNDALLLLLIYSIVSCDRLELTTLCGGEGSRMPREASDEASSTYSIVLSLGIEL